MCVCVSVCICVCLYVYICVCLCVCLYVLVVFVFVVPYAMYCFLSQATEIIIDLRKHSELVWFIVLVSHVKGSSLIAHLKARQF